ncbi:MAG TPA: ribbon-helix-helix domain-containing protein [Pseudolabrys sp.]|nr:ribbon-helix-helix domain-containing protein [Pseudolabrys sp.]
MKSAVIKRSIILHGHKTSVSLEDEFWTGLQEIAADRDTSLSMLIEQIDRERDNCNLSSAVRIYVFTYFRARTGRPQSEAEPSAASVRRIALAD